MASTAVLLPASIAGLDVWEIAEQGASEQACYREAAASSEQIGELYKDYYENMTMAEIGSVLDLSESRVSQIHKEILQRLRNRFGTAIAEELVA